MSEQPEPDSGYAADEHSVAWVYRDDIDAWYAPHYARSAAWGVVDELYGPMTPLLPAVRPDGVPDDAVPFVGWRALNPHHSDKVNVYGPSGSCVIQLDDWSAPVYGLDIPAAPAPSLPERLRERHGPKFGGSGGVPHCRTCAEPLPCTAFEAADALEAGSQP